MADTRHPKANAERVHPDRPFVSEIPRLRKLIAARGLTGMANDAKWDRLMSMMRGAEEDKRWCPGFRYCRVDSGWVSGWGGEWFHDLPFPFISVLWLDLRFIEEIHRGQLLSPKVIDHSAELDELLSEIGFDYEVGTQSIRIFGYAPRDRSDFDTATKAEQGVDPNA